MRASAIDANMVPMTKGGHMKIVVGVDGSPQSLAALRFAAEEARLRGNAKLHLVTAWNIPFGPLATAPFATIGPLPELEREVATAAQVILEQAATNVDLTGLEVVREVGGGDAAKTMLRAAADADLLVVGSRGRGGFTGLLLGSVSQACAHHAPCPIVIVRDGKAA
jgi:nucleotide-binding universal stress UspA family protein